MADSIKDEKLDFLFQAILTLETVEDCYHFFEDLCTVSELQEMSRRMLAAACCAPTRSTPTSPPRRV
jgi:TrpR-related protein YerC/YecD